MTIPNTKPDAMKISGQIKHIELPPGWKLTEHHVPSIAAPSWKTFSPSQSSDNELTFYFRGRPLTRESQNAMKAILVSSAKQLNAKQIESIGEVLRDASLVDAFKFLNVGVQSWNGKTILVLEGRWNELGHDRFWMIIPTDDDCESVEEIWFQAPSGEYPANLRSARGALKSIQWMI